MEDLAVVNLEGLRREFGLTIGRETLRRWIKKGFPEPLGRDSRYEQRWWYRKDIIEWLRKRTLRK